MPQNFLSDAGLATPLLGTRTSLPSSGIDPSAYPPDADLGRQLQDLARRAQDILGHELLKHPSAQALAALGRAVLDQIGKARDLLQQPEPPPQTVARLIQSAHGQLGTIAAQIALCQSTVRDCSAALESARRIVAQERIAFQDLLPLFRRMFDDVRDAPELGRLVPVCGLDLVGLVESEAGEASLFVQGLSAGRVLLWALRCDPRKAERLPEFAVAALFEDVGRLLARARTMAARNFHARRSNWLEQQHPAIGAALLGALDAAPPDLARMVSQHHERLDGRGYPRGLGARDGLPCGRWLATATRFAALCLGTPVEGVLPGERLPGRVARSILAESEWGLWPVDFAQRLADQVAATEPAECTLEPFLANTATAEAARSDGHSSDGPERSLYLHDRERGPQGTHTEAGAQIGETAGVAAATFSPVELEWLREARGIPRRRG